MSAITLQSSAYLNEPLKSKQWITAEDLAPFAVDIKNINTNNAGEASLGANTFTGVQAVSNTTDTTSGSTGAITTTGGIGATKAIFGNTTITAVTSVITNTIAERTATSGVTVDGVLLKDGGVSANSTFAGFYPTAAQQSLTGAGAVNVTSYYTELDTNAGAAAVTLAAGSQIGQVKKIKMAVDGGDATLTLTGYTSIVFNDANDYAILLWNGSAWFAIENFGCTINA